MPRPHLPSHLSLNRFKSSNSNTASASTTASNTPLSQSRAVSPTRNGNMKASTTSDPVTSTPQQGDHKGMGLVLRVEVLKGRDLAAKDKSGTSDPFLVLTLGDAKEATSVINKTLNPEWNQTFELPITTADSALLEAVCWDKDRFKNDYMGEFDVVLEDLFSGGSTMPEPKWFAVKAKRSGRRKTKKDSNISGEVLLKFTLYDPLNTAATANQLLQKFYGVVADDDDDDEDDDELLARMNTRDLDDLSEEDDEDKEPSDETDEGARTPPDAEEKQKRRRRAKIKKLKRKSKLKAYEFSNTTDVAGVLFLEINRITDLPPEKNMTRTSFDMDPFVVASLGRKTYRTKVIKHDLNPIYDEKLVFQVLRQAVNYHLNFAVVDRDKFSGNDFVGTASFPLSKIIANQPEADPETGLYALPDSDNLQVPGGESSSERKKRFRIPLSRTTSRDALGRSSRNSSSTNLNKPHRSSSSNSLNSQARPTLPERESSTGPTSDPNRSVPDLGDTQAVTDGDDPDLVAFEIPLELKNKARWEDKHSPVLFFQAKYMSYQALRQQFWRAMLRQYDADDSGTLDKVELTTMLDTLGSTLHNSTIDGFFARFKRQNNGEDALTMDQAVICLEEQLQKSQETQSSMHTPHWKSKLHQMKTNESSPNESPGGTTPARGENKPSNFDPNSTTVPALEVSDMGAAGEKGEYVVGDDLSPDEADLDYQEDPTREEHVVEIQECPICHQPRLTRGSKTTDADIITHIATCASSDWRAVNNLVMAGFVTSSQAQRKWYSKVISKVCIPKKIILPTDQMLILSTGFLRRLQAWCKQCEHSRPRPHHWHD